MTAPVHIERQVVTVGDPVRIATALIGNSDRAMLYERPDGVGVAEGAAAEVIAHHDHAELVVEGVRTRFPGVPTAAVEAALATLPWTGWRAYGWAAFELAHVLQTSAAVDPATPLLHLFVPACEVRILDGSALLRGRTPADLDALEVRLGRAVDSVARLRPDPANSDRPDPAHRVAADIGTHGAEAYQAAVRAAVDRIRAGELDKVILSRAVPVDGEIDLFATYLTGRAANTPVRSYLIRLGGWESAGFSPEIVLTVGADGVVVTQPLAGTRALVGVAEIDDHKRAELFRDAKEVFEHAISVHLAGCELSAVCVPASVHIGDFMTVRERGSVQHLGSELSGRLAEGRTGWDAFASVFPAVTASGVPKKAACQLIRDTEDGDRGLYSGAALTVDDTGAIDAALVLRSVFRRDGRTWLRAGAGIVSRSRPERELEETREKLLSVSRYLVPARDPAADPASVVESAGSPVGAMR